MRHAFDVGIKIDKVFEYFLLSYGFSGYFGNKEKCYPVYLCIALV